ncbi:hypothetical protein EJ110_NYTH00124 [Nymphaea thermarum]|nr:hypothetical protein EJ110_NYTH00124 [Nymphaea thermarum]
MFALFRRLSLHGGGIRSHSSVLSYEREGGNPWLLPHCGLDGRPSGFRAIPDSCSALPSSVPDVLLFRSHHHQRAAISCDASKPTVTTTTTTGKKGPRGIMKPRPISPALQELVGYRVNLVLMGFAAENAYSVEVRVGALEISDHLGFALQLQNSAVSSLFLLYSVVGIADFFTDCLPLSPSIRNLLALFAFLKEFLLFYCQKKDPAGVENRYFSLLSVPIAICICCIVLEISYPRSRFPGLGIGIGLILQGTWFLQMGFSFTSWITHRPGCTRVKRVELEFELVFCSSTRVRVEFELNLEFYIACAVEVWNLPK